MKSNLPQQGYDMRDIRRPWLVVVQGLGHKNTDPRRVMAPSERR